MKNFLTILFFISAAYVGLANAGLQNDIPSCYAVNNVGRATPPTEHELFVLIDQTTLLDNKLRDSVRENVSRFIKPGTAFVVANFSAFAQGHYMEVVSAGTVEAPIPAQERDSIGVKTLRTFDACMQGQAAYGTRMVLAAVNKSLDGSSGSLARSDVMASIKELSARVRLSPAKDKVVFVISDMLENSSISNFYAAKNVRRIDPAKELKVAEENHMLGDFGGARVFVLGAGIVPETNVGKGKEGTGIYREPKAIAALKQFWQQFFSRSHAELVEFGQPALMMPVR